MAHKDSILKYPMIWTRNEVPEHEEHLLLTLKDEDGNLYVDVDIYLGDDFGTFLNHQWDEIVAVARRADSQEEFERAKQEGLDAGVVWHKVDHSKNEADFMPKKSDPYLVVIENYEICLYADEFHGEEEFNEFEYIGFESYEDREIAAWAEFPAPCKVEFPQIEDEE